MRPHNGTATIAKTSALAKNYFVLTGGECVSKVLTFAAFTYLGRTLGPERYGSLEFTLAAMVFFTLPVDLGLGDYGAREVARNRTAAVSLLDHIASLRLVLATFSFCALAVFVCVLNKSTEVKLLLAFYGVSLFGAPALLQWFFQGHDSMHWVALASITRQTVFASLIFAVVRRGVPLYRIGFIECAAVYGTGLVSLLVLTRKMGFRAPHPVRRLGQLLVHFREAAPIGLSELAWAFKWYFATVLLGFMVADRSLGWFGASHRVVMGLHTFVWLYFFNLLPSISRSATLPREHLLDLMRRSMSVAAWSSTFVALVVTMVARPLMTEIYGAPYAGAGRLLALLIWMIPISMLSGHYRYTLIGYGRQKLLLYSISASAALSVVLCFALIPVWGAMGAAAGLLAGNLFNLALSYYLVRRTVLRIPLGPHLSKPAFALMFSVALFAVFARLSPWTAAAAAALGYLLLLFHELASRQNA